MSASRRPRSSGASPCTATCSALRQIGEAFDLPAQKVRVCFVELPNSQIELLEPLGADSPIAKFLEKNPAGGQHHLCFEVPDIHVAAAEMRARGATVLGEPRIGAHGTPVLFLHPKGTGGFWWS
jgi:methylmalonyl-CoA/ethylmalonyl-CoA epimerase